MSVSARFAAVLLVATHLAAGSAPCPKALPAHDQPDSVALAGTHPCPGHSQADDSPSEWLDARCPCGCQTGTAPGSGTARIGPALLLAELALVGAPDRDLRIAAPPPPARFAPAPPDHVPLIA